MRLGDPQTIPAAIVDFSDDEERIVRSLASQAAMLIERAHLYEQLKVLPLSFIDALISALEARDTHSSGHSKRVATSARALAKAVNSRDEGIYQTIRFTPDDINEIYYAALVHDIGKIGVSEAILLKHDRISTERARAIRLRFQCLRCELQEKSARGVLEPVESRFLQNCSADFERLMQLSKKEELEPEDRLFADHLYQMTFQDFEGKRHRLLDAFEHDSLLADRTKLTSIERDVMELHVTFSHDLLRNIHWPETLSRVPAIVKEHHERLDGSGYPDKLSGNQISLAGRILAIADRFDTLVSKNRSGQRQMNPEDALVMLRDEAEKGELDLELVTIFDRAGLIEQSEITRSEFIGEE